MAYKDKEKQREYRRDWNNKNREKLREYQRKYYQKNKERINELRKDYTRKYQREYYQKHKIELNEKYKESRKKSNERFRLKTNWSKYCYQKKKERIERLKAEGVTNPWSVVNNGADPKYGGNNE